MNQTNIVLKASRKANHNDPYQNFRKRNRMIINQHTNKGHPAQHNNKISRETWKQEAIVLKPIKCDPKNLISHIKT